jgi:hypothetical protein
MAAEATIGYFGDARRAAAGAALVGRVIETGSLVLAALGRTRAQEMQFHRFLSAPSVTVAEMAHTVGQRTAAACTGQRILAIQDTTEVNFAGRAAGRRALGPAGDGVSPGFFLHPTIAVAAEPGQILGLVAAQIWTRPATPVGDRRQRRLDDKESARWLSATTTTATRLAAAAQIIMVADRESDLYAQFVRRPATVDLLIRAAQDRAVVDGGKLFAAAAAWPERSRTTVTVAPRRPGDPGRTASVALRAGPVLIKRPRNGFDPQDPPSVALTLVEVREVDPPAGVTPVLWRLLTTLPADTVSQINQIVQYYRWRWRIEQVFRALKSDGLDLEATQLQEAERLFKLAMIGLIAAVRTQQLVDARDGSCRPASDVIDPNLLPPAEALNRRLQGHTVRQQNPHPLHSLAWLAWIIARLGGWNCYYKPPGPKIMRRGWTAFEHQAEGFLLALQLKDL